MASSSREGGDDQNFDKFYEELRKVRKYGKNGKRKVFVLFWRMLLLVIAKTSIEKIFNFECVCDASYVKEEEEANKMTKEEQIGRLLRPGYTYRLAILLKMLLQMGSFR